jgi:hypothetical protein
VAFSAAYIQNLRTSAQAIEVFLNRTFVYSNYQFYFFYLATLHVVFDAKRSSNDWAEL